MALISRSNDETIKKSLSEANIAYAETEYSITFITNLNQLETLWVYFRYGDLVHIIDSITEYLITNFPDGSKNEFIGRLSMMKFILIVDQTSDAYNQRMFNICCSLMDTSYNFIITLEKESKED